MESQHIQADETVIRAVSVFSDRAEVTRTYTVDVPTSGKFQLQIERFPEASVPKSFRAGIDEGSAQVLAVTESSHTQHDDTIDGESRSTRESSLRQALVGAQRTLREAEFALSAAAEERALLDAFASRIVEPPRPPRGQEDQEVSLDDVDAAMTYYDEAAAEADVRLGELESERLRAQRGVTTIENQLQALHSSSSTATRYFNLTVTLRVETPGPVGLVITHMISNASWTASYDLRVGSGDDTLAVHYHGVVVQHTGEDWNGVRLTLSTAQPAIGGSPPILPILYARHEVPIMYEHAAFFGASAQCRSEEKLESRSLRLCEFEEAEDEDDECVDSLAVDRRGGGGGLPEVQRRGASTKSSTAATTFEIEHDATIPSDANTHKVRVGTIDMQAYLSHYIVPSKSTTAFIKAEATNESELPMLASDDVSVFIDDGFIGKSSLKAVSPGEQFSTYVGQDPSISVRYVSTHDRGGESGSWLKSGSTKLTGYDTFVRNTKSVPVSVTVSQQLPQSTDSRLKVRLVEPPIDHVTVLDSEASSEDRERVEAAVKAGAETTTLDTTKSVISWTRTVAPAAELRIPFVYRTSYPTGSHVQLTETLQ